MKVCLCSIFRNSAGYLDRYFEQVEGLAILLETGGDSLRLILGYGDSADGTGDVLRRYAAGALCRVDLVECSHGGPVYGPVVDARRFRQLAHVGNAIWGEIPLDVDSVVWLESDLVWLPSTLANLIDRLADYPAIAPMILGPKGIFYDTWAFRRNGAHFTNQPPFHPDLNGKVLQLDSAGSCLALRGDLAQGLLFPEEDVIVGACRSIYARGGSVWVDPGLTVRHP